jgi:hypothetical protein
VPLSLLPKILVPKKSNGLTLEHSDIVGNLMANDQGIGTQLGQEFSDELRVHRRIFGGLFVSYAMKRGGISRNQLEGIESLNLGPSVDTTGVRDPQVRGIGRDLKCRKLNNPVFFS